MGWPPSKACETCKFHHCPRPQDNVGECRRSSPQVVWNDHHRRAEQHFPKVRPDDWCGEYVYSD